MICANDEKFAATVGVCQNEMDIELIKVYWVLELVLLTTFALSAGDGRGGVSIKAGSKARKH